jgi:hypothetical protein
VKRPQKTQVGPDTVVICVRAPICVQAPQVKNKTECVMELVDALVSASLDHYAEQMSTCSDRDYVRVAQERKDEARRAVVLALGDSKG